MYIYVYLCSQQTQKLDLQKDKGGSIAIYLSMHTSQREEPADAIVRPAQEQRRGLGLYLSIDLPIYLAIHTHTYTHTHIHTHIYIYIASSRIAHPAEGHNVTHVTAAPSGTHTRAMR